jgi:predicted phage tail protein
MDQKLDDHGKDLREIRNAIVAIATQAERINALTSMQNELRSSMNEMELRVRILGEFQAACPKGNVITNIRYLWTVISGVAAVLGASFLAHIFGGGNGK